MFFASSQVDIKSKGNWKCFPKQRNDQNSSFQSKGQKCMKFTPRSSQSKNKDFQFLKALNQKRVQSKNNSPKSRASKSKIIGGSTINLTKQEEEDRVQQINSIRLQKKGSRGLQKGPMYSSSITNNGSIDLSRIGGQGNKSFLGSAISKRGICQLLNLDEKETRLKKNLVQYKKLIKEFKLYLKNELQKMQLSYIHAIYNIKKRYEDEIKQLKNAQQQTKRDHLAQSDKMQSLGLDSVHLYSSSASKFFDNTARQNKRIGSIVKCKNKIESSAEKIYSLSYAENPKKLKFQTQIKHLRQESIKLPKLQQSQKSIAEKYQREKSFEKIFHTLRIIQDTINDNDDKDKIQEAKMEISQQDNSLLQSQIKEHQQWGFYSFKVPDLGTMAMSTPKNIKKITFQNGGEFFKQQPEKYQEQSDEQNTIEENQICDLLEQKKSKSLKPPLLSYSQDLYGSIRTACFDESDPCHNELLSPKCKKNNKRKNE